MTSAKITASLATLALFATLAFTWGAGGGKQDQTDKKADKQDQPDKKADKQDQPDKKADKQAGAAEAKPATFKVEKKPFRIELTVKGMLAGEHSEEISYRPLPSMQPTVNQEPQTIRTIVDHGAHVKKGDVLVSFDTTKIDEAIADLEREIKFNRANIKLAEDEMPTAEKSVPIELASADTAKKRADEELKYFLDIDRGQMEKQAEFYVKSMMYYKEYSEEELRQLEKMYKANDLTEETEKIILRRSKHRVEMANFWYQSALIERDYILKHYLPNREQTLRETQAKQELTLAKAQQTLAPALAQKQAALEKMHYDRDRSADRLGKLVKDRAAMTIHAPIAGVVYHGKFRKGHWAGTSDSDKLTVNSTVAPNVAFLTVVQTSPLVVYATVDEKDVHLLKTGLEGKATLVFNPNSKPAAQVTKVAPLPAAPGKFEVQLSLDLGAADAKLMPGMASSVKFVPYSKKDALAVPAKSIDEEDDESFVYVVTAAGKHEKRQVTTGRTNGEQTEILSGLREGEEILLERPDSKKPATEKGTVP
jgi:multidrug efflux pump subunit AcrA (membrane-fusion protein)